MSEMTPDRGDLASRETPAKTSHGEFALHVEWVKDYEFRVRFDKPHYSELVMDEPAPLGGDAAPNPSRVLAAAVGNCLCASLLFCARRSRIDVSGLSSEVRVKYVRNEKGRLRIGRMEVDVRPHFQDGDDPKARRCLELFEDYCVVTQSVRQGIDIAVSVKV